ncbi:hypothetical protein ANN_08238 [Periplaneta americana]|uniref:Uncharacterized protein n=1 Tax=Periplaneta americana TaxID=6978 RepID=A0ABQ8T2E8_PERAM|nr:hypothetical protein ANN_08238 [Periplaneta americana]
MGPVPTQHRDALGEPTLGRPKDRGRRDFGIRIQMSPIWGSSTNSREPYRLLEFYSDYGTPGSVATSDRWRLAESKTTLIPFALNASGLQQLTFCDKLNYPSDADDVTAVVVVVVMLLCVDGTDDSAMLFGEMRPGIRHRISDIRLTVGENLEKKPNQIISPSGDRTRTRERNSGSAGKRLSRLKSNDNENLVVPPLVAITAATQSGMFSTSLCRIFTGLRRHSSCNVALRWTMEVDRISRNFNRRSNSSQRCSMGLRSGLRAGQSNQRLRWADVTRMGKSRNAYSVLVGRPEGKRPLGRPRRSWEDNIKMDLREVGYDGRDWINLAQDRDRWRAYVRAAMNLRAHQCASDPTSVKVKEAVPGIKRRAEAHPNEHPATVLRGEIEPINDEAILIGLPNRNTLLKDINRQQNEQRPPIPRLFSEVVIRALYMSLSPMRGSFYTTHGNMIPTELFSHHIIVYVS